MANHVEASDSRRWSRRDRDRHTLSGAAVDSPQYGADPVSRNVAEPAEVAQARVFERLLQAESAELEQRAHQQAGDRQLETGELSHLRARLDEIAALLQALQGRFPRAAPHDDR